MKSIQVFSIVVLLWSATASAQQLTDVEKKDGFESLFNGRDLAGWRFNSGKGDNWEVKDGLLVLRGGSDHLASEKEYGDFTIRFEWRAEKKGYDSGFYIRSGKTVGANQIQLGQGGEGSFGGVQGSKSVPMMHRPPGEWNLWEVTCVGDRVTLAVNGEEAWEGTGLKTPRGYFGIQAEGHHIDFRNFRIKELSGSSPAAAGDFFFKDGDAVVMIGDSITEQHLYSNYVEMWAVTRFPAWKLTFRNVGIGGDVSPGGNNRFKRDVLAHAPTAMTVDFGMNDGGYGGGFNEDRFKAYVTGLQGMADQAKAANIRVAWVTPQPLDGPEQGPTALTNYNLVLEKFSEGVKSIAARNGGLFVDQFHPYLAVLDKARAAQPNYQRITAGDAVHPGPPGQALMAASILNGLGFPRLVASIEIDAASSKAVAAKNCQVTNVRVQDGGIAFDRLDAALPFFPPEAESILRWAPLLDDLNDYGLKVTGLKAGRYEIRLGGTKVVEHAADELTRGVNLAAPALAAGPIADQVRAAKAAIEAKNRFHHDRIFRGVVLAGVSVPDWLDLKLTPAEIESRRQAAYKERMATMPELDAAVRKSLEMKSHRVEIVPAAN